MEIVYQRLPSRRRHGPAPDRPDRLPEAQQGDRHPPLQRQELRRSHGEPQPEGMVVRSDHSGLVHLHDYGGYIHLHYTANQHLLQKKIEVVFDRSRGPLIEEKVQSKSILPSALSIIEYVSVYPPSSLVNTLLLSISILL